MDTVEKKYLSLEGLQKYDAKIKAKIDAADAAAEQAAKDYADSLADNYDPAGTAQTKVNELAEGQVKTNTEAIEAINNEETGILKQAKDYADGKDQAIANAQSAAEAAQAAADGAQADVDALTAADGKVTVLEGQVAALIAGTYDDTEVRNLIKTNADDIDALEGRADALEGQVTTLVGDDANKSVRTIANEELAKQLIAENAAESLDTLTEIAAWIQAHPGDAAAMNQAISDLEALVGTLPEGVTATTIVGYIQEIVAAEKARAEGVESGLDTRLAAVEGLLGEDGDDTVDARIATAKQEAIDAAAADATEKAGQALTDAKAYTDAEIDKVEETVAGLTETVGTKAAQSDLEALIGRVDTAESEIDTLQSEMDAVEALAASNKTATETNAAAIALKADATALGEAVDRITELETWHANFTEVTEEEINNLFA